MACFKTNIEHKTEHNNYYRKVIYTNNKMQLVLMSLDIGESIPEEKHRTISQFFRVEEGNATAWVKNHRYNLKEGDCLIVPPNTLHTIKQTGNKPLKLYTIYTPPNHKPNRIDLVQPESDD